MPSHCCGVFGLKPTRGRNPAGPENGEDSNGLTAPHVISRSVRDFAAALDATAGPDPGCRYFVPAPSKTFLECVDNPRAHLRIAFSIKDFFGGGIDPEIADAVRKAAQLCADLGHHVEETDPPFDPDMICDILTVISAANLHSLINSLATRTGRPINSETLEAFALALYRRGETLTVDEFVDHLDKMNTFSRVVGRFFTNYDVVITPPFSKLAPKLGEMATPDPISDLRESVWSMLRFAGSTAQYNITGQPAMSMPLYESANKLPIGVQFAARFADEETLFSLAGQLEKTSPWRQRRPSIFAH